MQQLQNDLSDQAHKFVDELNRLTKVKPGDVVYLAQRHGLKAHGAIVKGEIRTGTRFLFNDDSFVDFYLEGKNMCFFGTNGSKDIKMAFNKEPDTLIVKS